MFLSTYTVDRLVNLRYPEYYKYVRNHFQNSIDSSLVHMGFMTRPRPFQGGLLPLGTTCLGLAMTNLSTKIISVSNHHEDINLK